MNSVAVIPVSGRSAAVELSPRFGGDLNGRTFAGEARFHGVAGNCGCTSRLLLPERRRTSGTNVATPRPSTRYGAYLDPIGTLERAEVTFLAACVDGEVACCGAVKRMPRSCTSQPYGEIKRMYVNPDARGRGMGGALLDALESSLLTRGITIAP